MPAMVYKADAIPEPPRSIFIALYVGFSEIDILRYRPTITEWLHAQIGLLYMIQWMFFGGKPNEF